MPKPLPLHDFPEELKAGITYGPYLGYMDRIVDGDTVVLVASVGLDDYPVFYGRLKDVSAPEMHEPGGPECMEALALLCTSEEPVRVTTEKRPRSGGETTTFGRYVVELEMMRWNMPGEPCVVASVNELQRQNVERIRAAL